MSIEIRKAKQDEAGGLAQAIHDLHGEKFDLEFGKSRFNYLIDKNFIIIARDTETQDFIGRAMFEAIEDPRFGTGMVWGVEVWEGYKGKGIGTKILQTLIEEASKYFADYNVPLRFLYVFTRSSNHQAKALYRKVGFREGPLLDRMFTDEQPQEQLMIADFRNKK